MVTGESQGEGRRCVVFEDLVLVFCVQISINEGDVRVFGQKFEDNLWTTERITIPHLIWPTTKSDPQFHRTVPNPTALEFLFPLFR